MNTEKARDLLTRMQDLESRIIDLRAEAAALVSELPRGLKLSAEAYDVAGLGASTNPYDTTFSTITEDLETLILDGTFDEDDENQNA